MGSLWRDRNLSFQQWPSGPVRLVLLFVLIVGLSGCVQADVTLVFKGQTGGEVRQGVVLSESLAAWNPSALQQWQQDLRRQVKRYGGQWQTKDAYHLSFSFPFSTAQDLETKLSHLWQASNTLTQGRSTLSPAHLRVHQQNWLLFSRVHFVYDLDLKALPFLATQDNARLEFALATPWGARPLRPDSLPEGTIDPPLKPAAGQLIWILQPGQCNHLEAVFWYNNSLGWGSGAILALVAGGLWARSHLEAVMAHSPSELS